MPGVDSESHLLRGEVCDIPSCVNCVWHLNWVWKLGQSFPSGGKWGSLHRKPSSIHSSSVNNSWVMTIPVTIQDTGNTVMDNTLMWFMEPMFPWGRQTVNKCGGRKRHKGTGGGLGEASLFRPGCVLRNPNPGRSIKTGSGDKLVDKYHPQKSCHKETGIILN